MKSLWLFLLGTGFLPLAVAESVTAAPAADTPSTAPSEEPKGNPLVWDAMEKALYVKAGESVAEFSFKVTNKSSRTVTIRDVHTSCGCTVAELPSVPWVLAPGATGVMRATVELAGKEGRVMKSLEVDSTEGLQNLGVTVIIPEPDEEARERNRKVAQANRQAVFQGSCAACHATPTAKKTGGELFLAACGVCHTSTHRASMVPDLLTAREHRDATFWRKWISDGKEQGLMPAFAQDRGGPLTPEQIESLVEFCVGNLPREPRAN